MFILVVKSFYKKYIFTPLHIYTIVVNAGIREVRVVHWKSLTSERSRAVPRDRHASRSNRRGPDVRGRARTAAASPDSLHHHAPINFPEL